MAAKHPSWKREININAEKYEKLKENFTPIYETFKITLIEGNKSEGEDQIVLYSILIKKN